VAEYYSPRAKKRWCLSLYNNVGHHALGVFPQAATVNLCTFYLSLTGMSCLHNKWGDALIFADNHL